jgi:cell division protein FtsW
MRKGKYMSIPIFDYSLLMIIIALLLFGLLMLYSTSAYNGLAKFNDEMYYLKKQLFATALGLAGMYAVSRMDMTVWYRLALPMYLAAICLCTAVLFIGRSLNNSKRWIYIGPVSFQPSEFAKVAIIVFLAAVISRTPETMGKLRSMIKVMLLTLPLFALVAVNNLSTAIIILGIAATLVFVSSPRYVPFLGLIGVVLAAGVVFIRMESYRLGRIEAWLDPENAATGYQIVQGLYAIGSGGIFGKGLGMSMQKLGFVPEAQNDMVYSIICEELGLCGAAFVILLFAFLIWRFFVIASGMTDLFSFLVVIGVMAHIAIQVVLNIAVVTNTIPNTGITLPFISYGGTSICFLLIEMGIVLRISGQMREDKV